MCDMKSMVPGDAALPVVEHLPVDESLPGERVLKGDKVFLGVEGIAIKASTSPPSASEAAVGV